MEIQELPDAMEALAPRTAPPPDLHLSSEVTKTQWGHGSAD